MCMFNAWILYSLNTDRPKSRREFHISVINSLVVQDRPLQLAPLPVSGPGGDGVHRLEHLPGKNNKKCVVCNLPGNSKGKSDYWCPGCNAGVHKLCYSRLEHYWRNLKGRKRRLDADDSE